ncbi:MAG TPA: YCF48-related protein [Bryobacteraceae bacterium]|nr:YCF48-related protein [Bryobacteraceae bacterium]
MRPCPTSCGLAALLIFSTLALAADPHWEMQYNYRQVDSALSINDFLFTSATRGIVCGFTTDRHGKENPLVLVTKDAGKTWTELPVKEAGLSLFFLDDSDGWMVTEKGVWQTVEGGRSWTKMKSAPSGLLRIWFLDKKHGFAAGLEKRVFETTNGGETWTLLPIATEAQGDATYTTYGEIAFSGNNGIIAGWNVPPRKGGPDWMEPERAARRPQLPNLTIMLQTKDAGKTWAKSEASIFGQITRISMAPQGIALGLVEYKDEFEFPSEVYRVDTLSNGSSDSVFRDKNRAITDVRTFAGSTKGVIAGYETEGSIYRSPIPGKLKVMTSDDLENWHEMPVDYKAVAHRAMIAGPDENHLWIATDTGMILKLVTE